MGFLTMPISRRHLNALVEELQTLVNRMEASLHDRDDLDSVRKKAKQFEDSAKHAQRRRDELREEITQMETTLVNMKAEMRTNRAEMRAAGCYKCEGDGCDFCKYGFDGFGDLFG